MNGRKKLRPKNWNEGWREEINNGSEEGWNEKWKEGKKERKKARLYECTWLTHQPLFSFITARFRNKVNTKFSHFNEPNSCLACVCLTARQNMHACLPNLGIILLSSDLS